MVFLFNHKKPRNGIKSNPTHDHDSLQTIPILKKEEAKEVELRKRRKSQAWNETFKRVETRD